MSSDLTCLGEQTYARDKLNDRTQQKLMEDPWEGMLRDGGGGAGPSGRSPPLGRANDVGVDTCANRGRELGAGDWPWSGAVAGRGGGQVKAIG